MTKSELIARLAVRFPSLTVGDYRDTADTIFEALAATLANGDRVEIRRFGTFTICYRPPRTARNSKTGATVAMPGKTVPHFRAGKLVKEMVATATNRGAPSRRNRLDDLLTQIPPGTRFEEFDFGPTVGREALQRLAKCHALP